VSLNVELLRSSLALVVEREPVITRRFYEVLFERYPQVRPLFGKNAQVAQQKMLQEAIVAVVDHLEDAGWLARTLGAMGRTHALDYGVTPEMYAFVGDALLTTLAELAGDDWTPAMAEAWGQAYAAIRDLMLAGVPRPVA
jgi:hemoglobin-like flavoprotein